MQLSLLRGYSAQSLRAMNEDEACRVLCLLRWWSNLGAPECPHCGAPNPYRHKRAKNRWTCRECQKQFRLLSGTAFACSKFACPELLFLIRTLLDRGNKSLLSIARDIDHEYKALWILDKKVRAVVECRPTSGLVGYWQRARDKPAQVLPK